MSVNLSETNQSGYYKVVNIDGGLEAKKRLKDLGILQNEEIQIIKNDKVGPVIIEVKGAKIALGRNLSKKIIVGDDNV